MDMCHKNALQVVSVLHHGRFKHRKVLRNDILVVVRSIRIQYHEVSLFLYFCVSHHIIAEHIYIVILGTAITLTCYPTFFLHH